MAVRNAAGKIVMEWVIETKANTILQFFDGLPGQVQVTFEEGTWAAWLYDLLKPHGRELYVQMAIGKLGPRITSEQADHPGVGSYFSYWSSQSSHRRYTS